MVSMTFFLRVPHTWIISTHLLFFQKTGMEFYRPAGSIQILRCDSLLSSSTIEGLIFSSKVCIKMRWKWRAYINDRSLKYSPVRYASKRDENDSPPINIPFNSKKSSSPSLPLVSLIIPPIWATATASNVRYFSTPTCLPCIRGVGGLVEEVMTFVRAAVN